MIEIRRAADRGHANHGWLDTYHTFSFAGYHDERFMGFRSLRVLNDDTVRGGTGFGPHPHRDMEILTYVLSGALLHRDSLGHEEVIREGDVQHVSAGKGIRHSEMNASPVEPVHFLQIWIEPSEEGLPPRLLPALDRRRRAPRAVAARRLRRRPRRVAEDRAAGRRPPAPPPRGGGGGFRLRKGSGAWVHVADGALRVNDELLATGDGAGVTDEAALAFAAKKDTRALVFEP